MVSLYRSSRGEAGETRPVQKAGVRLNRKKHPRLAALLRWWDRYVDRVQRENQRTLVPLLVIAFSLLLLGAIFSGPWIAVILLAVILGGIICVALLRINSN
jgi:hypothetical protein